jgi:SagB-type dehydrogenase family enzyme
MHILYFLKFYSVPLRCILHISKMSKKIFPGMILPFLFSCILALGQTPGNSSAIPLPAPQTDGGMPLMKALKIRHTSREFSDKKLTDQQMSNLLWAAWGINRPDQSKRTAPSAMNKQEIDVYVTTADGVFLYDAAKNSLIRISAEDARAKTGKQDFVKTAPVNLVFVADYGKMGNYPEPDKDKYAFADAAYISQNVYLFAASEGLATGVRANIDRDVCAKALGLKADQHVIMAQAVGFPK